MAQHDAVRDNRSASGYEIDRSAAVPRAEVFQESIAGARDMDDTYWSEQNGVLARNNVIPQVHIDSSGGGRYGEIAPGYSNTIDETDNRARPRTIDRIDVDSSIYRDSRGGTDVRIGGGVTWDGGRSSIYADVAIGDRYGNRGRYPYMGGHHNHHRYPSDYGYDRYGYNDYRRADYRYGNYGYGDPRYGGYRNGGYYGDYGYGDYRGGAYGAGRYGTPPFIPHRRPPEFDRPYGRYGGAYGDSYTDLRARTQAFRQRSYDEFIARRSEKLERIYEQRYERMRARGGRNAIDEIPDRRGIDPRNARNPETRSPYERTPAEIPSPPQQRERLYNNDLAPAPPGYDPAKWNDPEHLTTKYVVGRALESDLIPVLRQADLPKNDLKQITEQYWRQNTHLVERDGSKILGYNGEKLLIQDPTGKIVQSDTVVSIGGSDEQMQAGWSIEEDHRKIDFNSFKR